jgi:hypothetical protein
MWRKAISRIMRKTQIEFANMLFEGRPGSAYSPQTGVHGGLSDVLVICIGENLFSLYNLNDLK